MAAGHGSRNGLRAGLARVCAGSVTLALAASGALVSSAPAAAAACAGPTATWAGPPGGLWTVAANWSPAVLPAANSAVVVGPGSTVTGAGGSVCDLTATGSIKLGGALTVSGDLALAGTLDLNGSTLAVQGPSASRLSATSTIDNTAAGTGTNPPAGALAVRSGVRLVVETGAKVKSPAVLQLQTGSVLTTGGAGVAATLAGTGTLSWLEGTLEGALTLGLPTKVEGSSAHVLATGSTLTLGGATTLSTAVVSLQSQARVVVAGITTIEVLTTAPGSSGFRLAAGIPVDSGQRVTVSTGATLRAVTSPLIPSAGVSVEVPLLNHGSINLGASLNVPAGLTQDVQPGAPASAIKPVTGLLSPAVRISTSDGLGHFAPVVITSGGLGGKGMIVASRVNVGNAWLKAGYTGSCKETNPVPLGTNTRYTEPCAGQLTVQGDLHLSSTSDVRLDVRGVAADMKDKLQVEALTWAGAAVATGRAFLAGRISATSARPSETSTAVYTPSYGTPVTNLVAFAARTGTFAAIAGNRSGFGWKPTYDDSTTNGDALDVDANWVDIAPPTLRVAGLPAFTQYSSQSFVYLGSDNRAMGNYDVRWRLASPSRGFSAWAYPRSWQKTTATVRTLTGLSRGYTYCFSVRARDRAGNMGAWTSPVCTARFFDDRGLSASGGWYRPGRQVGFYGETFSRSTTYGAKLVRKGTHTRIGLTAYRCPSCGRLQVYSGSRLLKTINLYAARSGMTSWVSPVLTRRYATVTLRVVSRGKPVIVDSFGMAR